VTWLWEASNKKDLGGGDEIKKLVMYKTNFTRDLRVL